MWWWTVWNHYTFSSVWLFIPAMCRDFGFIKWLLRWTDCMYIPQQYAQLTVEGSWLLLHSWSANWWHFQFKKLVVILTQESINSDKTPGGGIQKEHEISFKISTYKHFIYRHGSPWKVEANTFINDITTSTFILEKKKTFAFLNGYRRKTPLLGKSQSTREKKICSWYLKAVCVYFGQCWILKHNSELTNI